VPTFARFEEIDAWREARKLATIAYRLAGKPGLNHDFRLRDQLRAAAVPAMANIAEGFERDGNQEFAQFLMVAKASAAEVQSHLYVALDARSIDQAEFEEAYGVAQTTKRMCANRARYPGSSGIAGEKDQHRPAGGLSVHEEMAAYDLDDLALTEERQSP
jgi:four helix bundle protein